MSRRPMSAGEFAALPRVTPTELAEESYQAKLRQRRPMPVGPAGLPVPDAKAYFRKDQDGLLLRNIARQAYLAYSWKALPRSEHDRVAFELRRLLLERFPPKDMAVLERYGFAVWHAKVAVEFSIAGDYEKPAVFDLPEAILAPGSQVAFRADLGGRMATGEPIPADLLPYFRTAFAIRRERQRFDDLVGFPSQFRVREGRWPRWFEIERQVPEVGEWLSEQRKSA